MNSTITCEPRPITSLGKYDFLLGASPRTVVKQKITIGKMLPGFVEYLRALNKSPDTIQGFGHRIRKFARFVGPVDVAEITAEHIRAFFAANRAIWVHSTVCTYHTAIKSFFRWLVEVERLLEANPAAEVRLGKPYYPPRKFIEQLDDIEKLLAACRNLRDRVIIALGIMAGLRAIEISRLRLEDIRPGRLIVFGKGNKYRAVPLDPVLEAMIRRYIALYKPKNKLIEVCRGHIRNIVLIVAKRAGVKVSSHVLRHTFATWALRNGDIETVRRLLGHTDVRTTMIYVHSDPIQMMGTVSALPYRGMLEETNQPT